MQYQSRWSRPRTVASPPHLRQEPGLLRQNPYRGAIQSSRPRSVAATWSLNQPFPLPNDIIAAHRGFLRRAPIASSEANPSMEVSTGYAHAEYVHCRMNVDFQPERRLQTIIVDIGNIITTADTGMILNMLPNVQIKRRAIPMPLTIAGTTWQSRQFVVISLYIPVIDAYGNNVIIKLNPREVNMVDGFAVGLLLGVDVMVPEGIHPLLSEQRAFLRHCGASAPIQVYTPGS